MTGLATADLLLIAAADRGELAYGHTVPDLYLWNGREVDQDTMRQIARLIADGFLACGGTLREDWPITVGERGKRVLQ